MTTWSEIRELANKLKKTQDEVSISRLSDRTWVDILRQLNNSNRLKLIFTTDGRSYLTIDELDKEIREEVEAHSGRVSLSEISTNLDVDLSLIESRTLDLITSDSHEKAPNRLIGIPGEVINASYIRHIAHDIMDKLEEQGQTSIGELTTTFSLPTSLVSTIMQDFQKTLFRVHRYGEKYITETFFNSTRAKVRGYFTAVIRPVVLSTVASKLQVPENLLSSIVSSLLASGRLCGTLMAGRGTFIPSCYTNAEDTYVTSFYAQNGYVEWSYLKQFGIHDPGSYLRFKLSDAIHVSGLSVGPVILDQLKDLVATAIRDSSWVDLSNYLPMSLGVKERAALIEPLIKDLPIKSVSDDLFLISNVFIEQCEQYFDKIVNEKAVNAYRDERRTSSVVSIRNSQCEPEHVVKRVNSSMKCGFGIGNREVKTKNVKKKYNPNKRRKNEFDKEDQDGIDTGAESVTSSATLFSNYLSHETLVDVLSSQFHDDVPVQVIEGCVDLLLPKLEQSFVSIINSMLLPSTDISLKREKLLDIQASLNNGLFCIQLFERGALAVDRPPLRQQLLRHLLKHRAIPLISILGTYLAYEFNVTWPETKTEAATVNANGDNPLSTSKMIDPVEVTNPESFYHLAQLLKRTSIPDAINASAALRDLVEVIRHSTTDLSDFYFAFKILAVDHLCFNLTCLSARSNNKRDREKQLKADELAIQLECQLKTILAEENSTTESLLQLATNATLAATCLFAQIMTGWPITAPGKCVPDLITWISDSLSSAESTPKPLPSAITILLNSNAIESLKKLASYITEQLRSPNDNFLTVENISQPIEQIADIVTKCRKQLYKIH